MNEQPHDLRPRDFAVLLLGSGMLAPRQRARDQQADHAGLLLKQRILLRLRDADPDSDGLESCMDVIIEELGPPTGPTRAIAVSILEEWKQFQSIPSWAAHVLDEAIRPATNESTRRGRQLPG